MRWDLKPHALAHIRRAMHALDPDEWPPPYEYIGRPTAWTRIVRNYGDPIRHRHSCPECYDSWTCTYPCTLEPDLEDRGEPFGSHTVCDQCEENLLREKLYQEALVMGKLGA